VTVLFRPARRDDVAAVVELLRDDALGQGRESQDNQHYQRAFAAVVAEAGNQIIVGELADRVVATYQITFISGLSLKAARRAQIESVRVAHDLRRSGIGKTMLKDAENRARAAGCSLMQLTMNKARTESFDFYQSLGFMPSHVGFKLELM
jgi:N-acetylglutamate synthase-like GNAT family acetyltransferase